MTKTLCEVMADKFRKGEPGHRTLTGFDFTTDDPLIRSRAIRAKCLECQGGQQAEVSRCQITDCTLWPWRMGAGRPRPGRQPLICEGAAN